MFQRLTIASCLLFCLFFVGNVNSQDDCVTYKLVPQTSYKTQPLTLSRLVNETVYQSEQVTTYKPVWTRETRYRKTVSYKPITKTSERVERYLVRRPITETSYRERQIEETSYETVTEMQEQRYLVEKPVVETQLREEKVVVRKPVTSTYMQTENVTTYKPSTVAETQLVQGLSVSNDLFVQAGRNRLRWLRPSVYHDPLTGYSGYRRGGLHWVRDQNLVVAPTVEPALLQQQVLRTTLVPETVQVQKPVQVTQYVDQVETRRVPVQVETTSKSIQVLKIPVTVRKPVTRIRTERVPVSETKYREEIYERRVPVTETSYQRVENVEPYDVEVCKWVAENKVVQVPRTVTRRVNYSVNQVVPSTDWISIPIDSFGNVVGQSTVVSRQTLPTTYRLSERISSVPIRDTAKWTPIDGKPVVETSSRKPKTVVGEPTIRKLSDEEFQDIQRRLRPDSVTVPETQTDSSQPATKTTVLQRPATTDSGSDEPEGSNNAADATPSLDGPPGASDNEPTVELQIDDSSDIDSRPGSSDENLSLNGSN